MADLPWVPVQMISIDHLTVFHECQRCKRQVSDKQTECCRASNFIMKYKVGMTVACPLGEFELISKSEDVVRVILNAESNKDWTSWTDGFRLLRTYFFNKFRDYNPAADFRTPMKLQRLKQLLSLYLKGYNHTRLRYFELKFRKLPKTAGNEGERIRYYCIMARPSHKYRLLHNFQFQ